MWGAGGSFGILCRVWVRALGGALLSFMCRVSCVFVFIILSSLLVLRDPGLCLWCVVPRVGCVVPVVAVVLVSVCIKARDRDNH